VSREIRQVRPFETLEISEKAMRSGVQLTVTDGLVSNAFHGETLKVNEDVYLHEEFKIHFIARASDRAEFAEAIIEEIKGLYPADPSVVNLVISVHNKRLKMTDVILNQSVTSDEGIPPFFDIAVKDRTGEKDRVRAFRTPKDGCEILVELMLGSELPENQRRPGIAWRKGSWLARVSIKVATAPPGGGPETMSLTQSIRDEYGIPRNAAHYVRLVTVGNGVLSKTSFDEILQFYVDEKIHNAVLGDPNSEQSQAIQLRWILIAIDAVIRAALAAPDFASFDPRAEEYSESVLRAILEKTVDKKTVRSLDEALEILKEDSGRFMSILEDRAEMASHERVILGVDGDE